MPGRPTLFLSYAHADNDEGQQVDFVIQELEDAGLEVRFDQAVLRPGLRLWQQIDQEIRSPDIDAWAIYATINSLQSEACLEELAYALDRALRTRGQDFPLIGIFPEAPGQAIVPSAIATRLWVALNDPQWAQSVAAGVKGESISPERSRVAPYILRPHQLNHSLFVEIAPRIGVWSPFVAFVPIAERDLLVNILLGPPGNIPSMSSFQGLRGGSDENGKNFLVQIGNDIDDRHHAYVELKAPPTKLGFGQIPSPTFMYPNPAVLFR